MVAKFVEHVLRKNDPLAVHWQAQEFALRRAVKSKSAPNAVHIGDQQLNFEVKIRNIGKVVLKHRPIARNAEWTFVVANVVRNEVGKVRPVLRIETSDVCDVEV